MTFSLETTKFFCIFILEPSYVTINFFYDTINLYKKILSQIFGLHQNFLYLYVGALVVSDRFYLFGTKGCDKNILSKKVGAKRNILYLYIRIRLGARPEGEKGTRYERKQFKTQSGLSITLFQQ